MLLVLLLLLVGVALGTPVSPAEIAAARMRCTTQCDNANKPAMAACMRECWNAFFSDRKQTARHASPKAHLPARAAAAKAARTAAMAKQKARAPRVAPAAKKRKNPKPKRPHDVLRHKKPGKAVGIHPTRHVRISLAAAHLGVGLVAVALMIFALL